MSTKNVSVVSLLLALGVSFAVGSQGYKAYEQMTAKAAAQAEAVRQFQEWKQQYTRLLPLEAKWNESLKSISDAKDLYTLHTILGNVPSSNPDTLLVERIERLTQNDRDLGAQRVCLSSGGQAGMVFVEKDFPTLMAGLETLSRRPDVQMGTIIFSQDKAQARAAVSPLCLLLRDAEKKQ